MPKDAQNVLIVGAGLAGLCCALRLWQAEIPFTILEASDTPGGRIKTDKERGFLLDRGFQIFLTAYPEAKALLDYGALELKPFFPGALVRKNGKFHEVADPWRRPFEALHTLMAPVGTLSDKLKMGLVRHGLPSSIKDAAAARSTGSATAVVTPPLSTYQVLKEIGFSQAMISNFFRPFLSGIFLESELETGANVFDFVFKMLAAGDNVLPAAGMKAIPEQIASRLPAHSIKLKSVVAKISANSVTLASGEELQGSAVVIATEEPQARRLLELPPPEVYRSQTCVYFSADKAPIDAPILVLNGENKGLVNNFCVPSNVAPSYAPAKKALLSASIVGDPSLSDSELQDHVLNQLRDWFGTQVETWEHLRTYRIKYALPDQRAAAIEQSRKVGKTELNVFVCGDYLESGSINGAMLSGRKTAVAVIERLGR